MVLADLLLSNPMIAGRETHVVELGASPRVSVYYKNTSKADIFLTAAEINLDYDQDHIDYIIGVKGIIPNQLDLTDFDISSPGMVRLKLERPNDNRQPLVIPAGEAREIAAVTFHVNQGAEPKWIRLLDWSSNAPSKAYSRETDITGKPAKIEAVSVAASKPPAFSGLSEVASINTFGES